ncbi:MAG: histidine kinase [Elusimicrobia bacterium GWC2_65_9]|nr:MAG: histidine kinase [Elusimicrobia bacterium GWC2_65_9]
MVIVFLFVSVILFVAADLAVRSALEKMHESKRRQERAAALASSLRLDFTRVSKSLKRAEVENPAARILCVDDEEVILDSFRKILVLDGYCVDTVQTGQEALGLLQSHHYDFVFTDLKMPAMDGMDVVKSVKAVRPDIDVVVITGYATVETAVECMKVGAMDYVQKPFTEDELRAFAKKAVLLRQDRIQKLLKPNVHITHLSDAGTVPTGEFSIPGGVLLSQGHSWASLGQDGAVKVGIDDFAKKLIGPVDAIEFPAAGMAVKAGGLLFSVRQKHRRVPFFSPVSGKVVKVNPALSEDCGVLELTPYQKNWVCVIDADNLDLEIPGLRIGKAAVAFFQDDLERFRTLMKGLVKAGAPESPGGDGLYLGELERLDDAGWDRVVAEFFKR